MIRAFAICALVALLGATAASAEGGRTPRPHPPRGQGEHCVRDTDFMRRNHMTLLRHQRDDTVHRGARSKELSLTGCISCHAAPGADGRPVSFADSQHFCRACHSYAAVSIDCFECHASRPQDAKAASGPATGASDMAAFVRELRESER
jgi:predicted CXXCH cytochrome family protein